MDFLHHWGAVWLKLSGKSSLKEKRNSAIQVLLASRHIKREKASLPVDARRSKTSLLKVPNVVRLFLCRSDEATVMAKQLSTANSTPFSFGFYRCRVCVLQS